MSRYQSAGMQAVFGNKDTFQHKHSSIKSHFQQGKAATTSSNIVKHHLHVCGLRDIHGTSISSLMYCKYKYYLFCAAELLVAHIARCPPGPHSEQSTHIMRILSTHQFLCSSWLMDKMDIDHDLATDTKF